MSELVNLIEAKNIIRRFVNECRHQGVRIAAKSIHKHFHIDYREFARNLMGEGPKKRPQQNDWIAFALAIKKDHRQVLEQLLGGTPPHLSGAPDLAELLMESALRIADDVETEDAVHVARQAFVVAWRQSPALGVRMLPRMLYVAHRYGTLAQLVHTVKRFVLPALDEPRKPLATLPASSRPAVQAMLACILNEGGEGEGARELFLRPEVRSLKTRSQYIWLPTMLTRNESHYWAWHAGIGGRAEDCANQAAERDGGGGKELSVANTRCETLMAVGHFKDAWPAIQGPYDRVQKVLSQHYASPMLTRVPPRLERFHHSYAAFAFGILAKLHCEVYRAEELSHDLSLVEAVTMVNRDGKTMRRIRIGHRPKVLVAHRQPELSARLQRMVAETRRETLTAAQIGTLRALETQLSRL